MNFLGLPAEDADLEQSRVLIQPVPYEQTSTFGSGSNIGPKAIIEASQEVELFDVLHGREVFRDHGGIATLAPITSDSGGTLCDLLRTHVKTHLLNQKTVVTCGGEHSSIVGAVQAYSQVYSDLTIIQFDAHSDLRETYQEDPWNHACAMARILDFHQDIIQIGIRSQAKVERIRTEQDSIPVVYAHEIHAADAAAIDWISPVIKKCRSNVYITFDCDAFDPSVIPATGTPEPGGLTWQHVQSFVQLLAAERRLVGFDISELAPIDGLNHPQFTMAKLIYRWLGYITTYA